MVTNNFSRDWLTEDYNAENEAFYLSNTKSLILSQWKMSLKHAIVTTLLLPVITLFFGIENPMALLVAMQIGYVFYGVLTYCHNDMGAGGLAYLCCLIYFVNRVDTFSPFASTLFYLTGVVLLFASVIPTILYRRSLGSYGEAPKSQWANDEEEFEAWKRKYYNSSYDDYYRQDTYNEGTYKESYNEHTYSQNASTNRTVDPNVEKARELFADFGSTYQELKKLYRKLAMQHHPDHGGDTDLFKAIVNEYEYIKKTKFPDAK